MTSLPTWFLESLRLTIFTADSEYSGEAEWWKDIKYAELTESTTRVATGERIHNGKLGDMALWLSISKTPPKIEWVMYAQPPADPLLADPSQKIQFFLDSLSEWIASVCPRTVRIAFGFAVQSPVSSTEEGYALMRRLLPFITFQDNWSEFGFQVNRKFASSILNEKITDGSLLNGISKWNVVKVLNQIFFAGNPVPKEYSAVRLELDLSTSATNLNVIDSTLLIPVAKELIAEGSRYMKEGIAK